MPGTILFAPHHDDVALSVGAMAVQGWFDPPLVLATVFSVSVYAPNAAFQVATSREVTELRMAEDAEFARMIGASTMNLGMKDAPLRHPMTDLGDLVRADEPELDLVEELSEVIRGAAGGSSSVVAPLGIGGHLDHLTVRAACESLSDIELVYYVDQPYGGAAHTLDDMAGLRCVGSLLADDQVCLTKCSIAALYASQPASVSVIQMVRSATGGSVVESIWVADPQS